MTAEERMRSLLADVLDAMHESALRDEGRNAIHRCDIEAAMKMLALEGEQGEPIPPGIPLTAEEQAFSDELDALQEQGEPAPAREPWCTYCGADSHDDAKCWSTRPSPFGPQNAGYKQRPQAGPARESSAVEEVNAAKKEGCFITAVGSYYQNVVGLDVALRHAEELDRLRAENAELRLDVAELQTRIPLDEWSAMRAENAALREQLQGGVVVPRKALEGLLSAKSNAEIRRIVIALATAKETKHG